MALIFFLGGGVYMHKPNNIADKSFSLLLVIFSVYSYLFLSIIFNRLIGTVGFIAQNKSLYLLLTALGGMALYCLLLFFLGLFTGPKEKSLVNVRPYFYLLLIGEAVLLQFLVYVFFSLFYEHFLPSRVELEFSELMQTHPWYVILLGLFVAPVFEELVFRRHILAILSKHYSAFSAIALSALIFGAFHLTPRQFIYTTLLGLIFGKIYLATGKIATTVVMHFAFNAFGLVVNDVMALVPESLSQAFYIVSLPLSATADIIGFIVILKLIKKMEPAPEGRQ